ncbi:MAG: preprotein translocase subunit SecA [Clostridiales Family XIII bacterium]|jgi:preprotein translocase subunit SecA|nr:preprotein translocase subunit SecA [Clostridiales Family XIII bacterium]
MGVFSKFVPDMNKKEVGKISKLADKVLALDEEMQALTDDELRAKTAEFKARVAAKEDTDEALDEILPEAFAVAREGAWRSLGMKHFPVQVIGGIALHQGRISEMKTGEGKTLVATLPAYLNALSEKGVHVVTVNDYLAKRDMEWMGKLYTFLGLTVGCVVHGITSGERKAAYEADITYGTNNEFGFDYLRDNMVIYKEELMQRPLNYAIVDEVDSILIDEARTPLIISGQGDKSTDLYQKADKFVRGLKGVEKGESERQMFGAGGLDIEKEEQYDFIFDEKNRSINLTESGSAAAEKYFGVDNFSDPENMELSHHVNQALKAENTMKLDVDYVVRDGEIIIVDEFTGRLMFGRRYSEGLHQAIEAKEGLKVNQESKTLATITIQNYFRMYNKLAGMTGTAKTEEDEFRDIYNMDVVVIPTNRDIVREDFDDVIFSTENGKFDAIVEDIASTHGSGQPILVGTISIEKSELISAKLKKRGIKHNILNAKHHEKEAEIVSEAGRLDTVTIATNMAGRGTDIILGGNPEFEAKTDLRKEGYSEQIISDAASFIPLETDEEKEARAKFTSYIEKYKAERAVEQQKVLELGGLYIIGTERHESRRIDNQLRGRAGRQGDPGSTRFFISMEDELLRLFGGERMQAIVGRLGVDEDQPIEASMLSKSIENAQKKVEGRNFSIRKYVLQYDNVMNKQREVIYGERKKVLFGEDMKENVLSMAEDLVSEAVDNAVMGLKFSEEWDYARLDFDLKQISRDYKGLDLSDEDKPNLSPDELKDIAIEKFFALYEAKEEEIGAEQMRELERMILLRVIDNKWMDHIDAMDQLKHGIGLRSIGQQDPAAAYAHEGFDMFELLTESIKEDTVKFCYNVTLETKSERKQVISGGVELKAEEADALSEAAEQRQAHAALSGDLPAEATKESRAEKSAPVVRTEAKVGRNDPCPCGSGKKYKNCCGKNE